MLPDTPSVSQLSHVISQAAAPAFLLGALAAFIAVLICRVNRIIDRTIHLNGIPDQDAARSRLKADLPRLMRRAAMLNRAIWSVVASISISTSDRRGIVSAFFQIQHERGVAILFIVSVAAFTVSLVDFAREVRIALSELDHHGRCEDVQRPTEGAMRRGRWQGQAEGKVLAVRAAEIASHIRGRGFSIRMALFAHSWS